MIAGSLRPFTTRASHNVSAEGVYELVKAPPGRCRQDRIAAGRFPQPLVSISQPARSGRCGSQPLAFAGDDQPRQFPSSSLPGMTAWRRARGWPACLRAWMPTWPGGGGGPRLAPVAPVRRAPHGRVRRCSVGVATATEWSELYELAAWGAGRLRDAPAGRFRPGGRVRPDVGQSGQASCPRRGRATSRAGTIDATSRLL